MLDKNWKILKSGTDIRGVATETPEHKVNLTDEAVDRILKGFALWLEEKTGKQSKDLTVSVGRDSRISGPRIRLAALNSLTEAGCQVYDCGLASTPSMFMTTVDLACDGAVQITASHHPYFRNGLKFFTRDGGLEGSDIERLLAYAQEGKGPEAKQPGAVREMPYMEDYSKRLRNLICKQVQAEDYERPLRGFHIVVDAGNGVGGFYAKEVLEPLGADISGSQFLEPDGMFPNHIPNPEDEEAMRSICKATVKAKADLGVIFDTDVDRGGAVDAKGRELNRNRLVAVASAIALENNKGGAIVTDSITSSGLKTFIEQDLGGVHHRYQRGYKNVINEALRLNAQGINCPLAIETSGHAALRENYFLDDGAYLVTKIIIKMAQLKKEGKTLDNLIEHLSEPVESREVRLAILEEDFRGCGQRVIKDLEQYAQAQPCWIIAPDNREGIRVSFGPDHGDGWFLLRLSVHDPILPLNVESDQVGGTQKILQELYGFLRMVTGIDISPLEKELTKG